MWPALAMMGASAALSMYREKKKADAMNKWNQGQAEVTKWSPWTGMKGDVRPNFEDPMGAGLQGGISGLGLYGSMKGAGLFDGASQAAAPQYSSLQYGTGVE
jgi:hypothetical protein